MRARSVWGVIAGLLASLGYAAQAAADVFYVSQERFVEARLSSGPVNRQNSMGFGPFNAFVNIQSPNNRAGGYATQDSTLGPITVRATGESSGSGERQVESGTGTSSMSVEFVINATSAFRLDGMLSRFISFEASAATASVRLSGPTGVVFSYQFSDPSTPVIDFSGQHALFGTLTPGSYTLNALAVGSSSGQQQIGRFDFSLDIPAPGHTCVIAAFLSLLGRRRRRTCETRFSQSIE